MSKSNSKRFQELHEKIVSVENEVRKVIIGQTNVIRAVLICLISASEKHILLEGVPGIGKTKMVNILKRTLKGAKFQRVQCTPDLLPTDITGTRVFEPDTKTFRVEKGPITTNLLLVDEINRASPRTQSALLEAMQELQFTIANETHKIERPFLVLATQNPIEQEGTYPLPEAQIDRFMMKAKMGYPSREEELEIVDDQAITGEEEVKEVMSCEDILQLRSFLKEEGGVYVSPEIKEFAVDIVRATRPETNEGRVRLGASPRASIFLTDAARSNAFLAKRNYVLPEDVLSVAYDVLRHRIILHPTAEETTEKIIEEILEKVREEYGSR